MVINEGGVVSCEHPLAAQIAIQVREEKRKGRGRGRERERGREAKREKFSGKEFIKEIPRKEYGN